MTPMEYARSDIGKTAVVDARDSLAMDKGIKLQLNINADDPALQKGSKNRAPQGPQAPHVGGKIAYKQIHPHKITIHVLVDKVDATREGRSPLLSF